MRTTLLKLEYDKQEAMKVLNDIEEDAQYENTPEGIMSSNKVQRQSEDTTVTQHFSQNKFSGWGV